jgi:MoxR-like ATPase
VPEAELARFQLQPVRPYPEEAEERASLALHHEALRQPESIARVLGTDDLERARAVARQVIVQEDIVAYVAALVRATRADLSFALGASPRAGVMLLRAAKAGAALAGRDFVLPEDVQEMALPALRHRVQLDPAAEVEGLTADEALRRTMHSVTVPR